MARDQDTIEREIERTREQLAGTLDRLGTKASPTRLVDSVKISVRARFEEPKVKYSVIGGGVVLGLLILRKLLR